MGDGGERRRADSPLSALALPIAFLSPLDERNSPLVSSRLVTDFALLIRNAPLSTSISSSAFPACLFRYSDCRSAFVIGALCCLKLGSLTTPSSNDAQP